MNQTMKQRIEDGIITAVSYVAAAATYVVCAVIVLGIVVSVSYAVRFGWELGTP